MKIHPVTPAKDGNRWCGPAALSIIAGITTVEAARLLRDVTGRRKITGTYPWELRRALARLGFKLVDQPLMHYGDKPTLAAWLRDTPRPAGRVYLVIAGNHWQIVTGRRYCCGRTVDIVSVRHEKVRRRARVKSAWLVERC